MPTRRTTTLDRPAGRTLRMVEGLRSRSTIVVHDEGMRHYVKRMIFDVRGPQAYDRTSVVVVRRVDDVQRHVVGIGRPILIDHAFYEHVNPDLAFLTFRMVQVNNRRHSIETEVPPEALEAFRRRNVDQLHRNRRREEVLYIDNEIPLRYYDTSRPPYGLRPRVDASEELPLGEDQ